MEVIDAVRGEWPAELPLFLRLSCTEWIEGGYEFEDTVALDASVVGTRRKLSAKLGIDRT